MKYLVIGSGGREHAISWRLLSDGSAEEVYVAPGNGGIDPRFRINVSVDDFAGIYKVCIEKKIDLVIVGPEVPLVGGLVDYLQDRGVGVFGPSAKAAMLEGSKLFAKSIMEKFGVPTAGHWDFIGKSDVISFIKEYKKFPMVIKLDGLAAGKGVIVAESMEEAIAFINENVLDDTRVFVEEFICGEEASVLGISDGNTVIPLVAAQDHKRIFDGDRGPNTGGMGAYAPAPVATDARMKFITDRVLKPVIEGMKSEGNPFKGILYAGLMIEGDEIKVLEFNARFGDPETQVILPLLDVKFGDLLKASVYGGLDKFDVKFKNEYAVTVVVSSGGYPGAYQKGKVITGLNNISDRVMIFHAGTEISGENVVTNGGRVLNVSSTGLTLREACDNVYGEIDKISFDGAFYRRDIAHRAL